MDQCIDPSAPRARVYYVALGDQYATADGSLGPLEKAKPFRCASHARRSAVYARNGRRRPGVEDVYKQHEPRIVVADVVLRGTLA